MAENDRCGNGVAITSVARGKNGACGTSAKIEPCASDDAVTIRCEPVPMPLLIVKAPMTTIIMAATAIAILALLFKSE